MFEGRPGVGRPLSFLPLLFVSLLFCCGGESGSSPDLNGSSTQAELVGVSRFGQALHEGATAPKTDQSPVLLAFSTLSVLVFSVVFGFGHNETAF